MQPSVNTIKRRSSAPNDANVAIEPLQQTGVDAESHAWLIELYKHPLNTGPRFRIADLLGACVSLSLAQGAAGRASVREHLVAQARVQRSRSFRRCDLFRAQFESLLEFHREPWNCQPHPMFELDHLASACVAVSRAAHDASGLVLAEARRNFCARAAAASAH